jgi:hypothetical protein
MRRNRKNGIECLGRERTKKKWKWVRINRIINNKKKGY